MNDAGNGVNGQGEAMLVMARALFPICRSITGDGVRETLRAIGERIPLSIREVPSGTPVLDWIVPKEWNIRDAFIATPDGTHVIDFKANNLHILQYSVPVNAMVPVEELLRHLHTLPAHPDWVPYRTSYYNETWGFCLRDRDLAGLSEPNYRVVIDSSLTDGALTYAESVIEGESEDTVLLSSHICHPSLANDNLAGIAVATALARALRGRKLRHTYRFLFIPGTIGSITWLALNEDKVKHIKHGLVLSCLGDAGAMHYKRSRQGNAKIDRIVEHVLKLDSDKHRVRAFTPYGYDERQYCSPGFNLPVGCLMRTPNGEYPEYHSSADNLSLLKPESLEHSLQTLLKIVDVIEGDATYRSLNPKGEPQLGRRGLYGSTGGRPRQPDETMAMLWVLNLADGAHSLLDTAVKATLPFAVVRTAADALLRANLLEKV